MLFWFIFIRVADWITDALKAVIAIKQFGAFVPGKMAVLFDAGKE